MVGTPVGTLERITNEKHTSKSIYLSFLEQARYYNVPVG